jgi:hypothetical protein
VGLGASLALVLKHIGALDLPGCHTGGGCDAASASKWGSIFGIPVAIIGAGHFAAMLAITVRTRGRASTPVIWGMRLAAAGSLVYVGISLGADLICPYCFTIHAANILLLMVLERKSTRAWGGWVGQAMLGGVAAALTYGVLVPIDWSAQQAARARAEEQLARTQAEIASKAAKDGAGSKVKEAPKSEPESKPVTAAQPKPAAAAETRPAPVAAAPEKPIRPLTGRYRFGPEKAPVRVVMFTDYQCPDCYKIEQELKALMESTPNLSVAIRYFPLSSKCNPAMNGQDMHPNACWAARCAETAGILKGADGFWKMHHWLFDRRGSFTDAELPAGLKQLGYEPGPFQQLMMSKQTQDAVSEDIEFARSLGIYFTPMIFINGVELRGWTAPNALTRAVQGAVAAAPPAAGSEGDLPPSAREKHFADWRAQPKVQFPSGSLRHTLGPADAKVEAVLIGDYSEKGTGDADGILRLFTSGPKPNIRYTFIQYPAHSDCNPSTQVKLNPTACGAAKAAEAAEALGGPEAFWAVHGYLMSHQSKLDVDAFKEAAIAAGLKPEDLLEAMQQPFVAEAISQDARNATALGIKALPMIFLDGKFVPRWKLENENLLAAMIFEVAGQEKP